ncbi:transcriptional regulator [Streptomyces sp. NEAU-S7GS2]|nr:transcriptional regulator [Streptomyces sp. NEAU-S7GS2]
MLRLRGDAVRSADTAERRCAVAEDELDEGVLLRGEENVALRLKIERETRGWSTNALSDRLVEAGYEMNPSAVWRIENGKRRINLDEAIGFAEVLGVSLQNLVGPPQLAAKARAMELIDDVVRAFRETQRAGVSLTRARDALDAYLAEHPDIREEADVMVSNAMAEEAIANFAIGPYDAPSPGEYPDDEQRD